MPRVHLTPSVDTWIDEANPGVAYGTENKLQFGYVTIGATQEVALLKWDVSGIPATADIIDCWLLFHYTDITAVGSKFFVAYKLTGAFNLATTWAGAPAKDAAKEGASKKK